MAKLTIYEFYKKIVILLNIKDSVCVKCWYEREIALHLFLIVVR